MGQLSTHRPQWMHSEVYLLIFFSEKTRTAFVNFLTGESTSNAEMPIIAPPFIILLGSFFNPQYSIISDIGVPIGTFKFLGLIIQSPSTVTIFSISGIPSVKARQIAAHVSTLKTTQPKSIGSLPDGISLPVIA
jgi:hypothetical protein